MNNTSGDKTLSKAYQGVSNAKQIDRIPMNVEELEERLKKEIVQRTKAEALLASQSKELEGMSSKLTKWKTRAKSLQKENEQLSAQAMDKINEKEETGFNEKRELVRRISMLKKENRRSSNFILIEKQRIENQLENTKAELIIQSEANKKLQGELDSLKRRRSTENNGMVFYFSFNEEVLRLHFVSHSLSATFQPYKERFT